MMNIKKIIALTIVVAGVLLVAAPAKAFYLELPNVLKFWQGAAKAQEAPAEVIAPAPAPSEPAPAPVPVDSMPPRGDEVVGESNPSPAPMPRPVEPQPQPEAGQPMAEMPQPPQPQPQQTCRVNGVEMPGSCEGYNNKSMYDGGGQNNMGKQDGWENGDNKDNGDRDQKMEQQNQEHQLKDMKRGIKDVQRNLKEFDRMVASEEKKGMSVPQEIKDKRQKVKELLDAANNATTPEEIGDMGELWDVVRELEDFRREFVESFQRLSGIKRGMRDMMRGLKAFESQVARLAKQKIIIPADVTETLGQLKSKIDAVNSAKTWEEAESAGVEDMWELMQTLEEKRQDLEMLARWPQTLKQMDKELKNLARQLKKDKTIVSRLAKQGIDLTGTYESFNAAIEKLKTVRTDADAKMKAGDSEGAFDLVENDFFGQMEDVWQYDRVIQNMSNLGQFKSNFKRQTAQAESMIKKLARMKKDVSEVKELLAQLKEKGNEILAMLKEKNIDEDAIVSAFEELENIGQEFEVKMSELMGEDNQIMPWEKGPQQFKEVKMSPGMDRYIPKKEAKQQPMNEVQSMKGEEVGESNPQPLP